MSKDLRSIRKISKEITLDILNKMPVAKKESLGKALERNMALTSTAVLSSCDLTVYKEGWYIQLQGTRCNFSVFAKDNDGEYKFIRKPNNSKLHILYSIWFSMDESDFTGF